MEVIYSKACGIDVHETFIVAVICDSTGDKPKYIKFKAFPLLTKILYNLRMITRKQLSKCMHEIY